MLTCAENVIGYLSGCHALVSIMKSAHLGKRHDASRRSRLDSPRFRSILGQCQMSPRAVAVAGITRDDPTDMPFVKRDHVIQTLAAQGTHEPLRIPILPRRGRGNRNLAQTHAIRRWNSAP